MAYRAALAVLKNLEIFCGYVGYRFSVQIANTNGQQVEVYVDNDRLLRHRNSDKRDDEASHGESIHSALHDVYGAPPTKLSARKEERKQRSGSSGEPRQKVVDLN